MVPLKSLSNFMRTLEILLIYFCGDNLTYKNLKKLSIVEWLFNIRKNYSLQPITLLDSVTDNSMRVFWNSCAENFGKLSEKRIVEFSFNRVGRIQAAVHYENALQMHSKNSQKRKNVLKFQKSKKNFFETVPFSLMLQSRSP